MMVAGPAALLVAKLTKLGERLADEQSGSRSRVQPKDALDIFRILQAVDVEPLIAGFRRHLADQYAGPVAEEALRLLRRIAANERARLPMLLSIAAGDDRTIPAMLVLVSQLLDALDR
jgi:hypothetical protein